MTRKVDKQTLNKWLSEAVKAKADLENLKEALENSKKEERKDWKIITKNKQEELNALEEAIIESKDPEYNALCALYIKSNYIKDHAKVVFDSNNVDANARILRLNVPGINYFDHSIVIINSNNLNEILLLRDLTLGNKYLDLNTRSSVVNACNERIKELKK